MIAATVLYFGTDVALAEHPAVELLQRSPEVHSVKVAVEPQGERYIIHIRDWHWLPYETVAAEAGGLSPDQYRVFLKSVEKVQAEQYRLMKRLIGSGYSTLFQEALTPGSERKFPGRCRDVWKKRLAIPTEEFDLLNSTDVLWIGTSGRLLAEGVLKRVRSADSDETLNLTRPFDETGQLRKVTAVERNVREDHTVREMIRTNRPAVLILGGGHDLTDNVKRLGEGKVGLIIVTTKQYSAAADESP